MNGGIRSQLARVFGEERADALLVRYHARVDGPPRRSRLRH